MSETIAVLTHAAREHDALASQLRANGVRVLELPCVTIEHLADPAPLAEAIGSLDAADWLVVTSPAGADAIARAASPRARVAAVGAATAARLRAHGIAVSFIPSRATGAVLGRELPPGAHALLARSDRALPDLPRILRERGFVVSEVVAYHTRVGATGDIEAVRRALSSRDERVAFYVESPSALDGLRAAIAPDLLSRGVITHVAHR
ncbi:MAG TPA: uroporphyrinogen-III synthase [Candidatus Acidoferrales bacterium]|nr:uroporphyrinogen-III synthase [Candidatus Acidoferrales bacterium]